MTEAVDATLGERAAHSPWVLAQPGLAESIAMLEQDLLAERASTDEHVSRLARPGLIPPLRAFHYFSALGAAQLGWAVRRLPQDLTDGLRPIREPAAWLSDSLAYVLRDQLALLGPAGAELARIVDESEGLAPNSMVDELRRRPIQAPPLPPPTVTRLLNRAFGDAVARIGEVVSATPISQLHRGVLRDGRHVFIRVRRPEVGRVIRQDARIGATLVGPIEWMLPPVRDAHPLGFVELAARQLLEEADLRNEALNAVEVGVAIETLEIDGLVACRPVAGLVDPVAVVFEAPEDFDGAVSLAAGHERVDGAMAVPAFARITIEAALALGMFHADLRPEQLLVLPDGRLGLIGYSTIGRLDRRTRRAALDWVVAVFSGDAAGQVAAMDEVGAVSENTDVKALLADLEAADSLQPMALLAGGEAALLAAVQDGMRLFLRHRLRPPLELVLFVRTLLSLRALLRVVAPDRPITEALLPLLPRLPELRARLAEPLPT
jgi:ubiquinone biosynthesis protein